MFERVRVPFADAMSPVLEFLARPATAVDAVVERVTGFVSGSTARGSSEPAEREGDG
jgi:hypothetical protein